MSSRTSWQIGAVAVVIGVTVAASVAGNRSVSGSEVTVAPTAVKLTATRIGPDGRIKLAAAVSLADGGDVPGGSVEFVDETQHTVLGITDVSVPWIAVDRLSSGPHEFRANYGGVTSYFPFVVDPSRSAPLSYADQVTPAVDLSSTQNPSRPGETVTLTAVVRSPAGTPSGTVKFLDIDRVLADHVRLDSNGVASFTTSALREGSRRIVAIYEGDARNSMARSRRLAQDVGVAAATALHRVEPRGPRSPALP
ncbi:MAG TPA: Ig-like domain-containing protein [Nitrobacter sp.]|nr:Ig-like domain-containing protein [Nitrobacter sp.]